MFLSNAVEKAYFLSIGCVVNSGVTGHPDVTLLLMFQWIAMNAQLTTSAAMLLPCLCHLFAWRRQQMAEPWTKTSRYVAFEQLNKSRLQQPDKLKFFRPPWCSRRFQQLKIRR
jgi:hypothetical protein